MTQKLHTAPIRNRYEKNYAIDFGRRRLRFPAAGRRKRSYDSLLQVFAKKTSPSRFRRAAITRFPRPAPRLANDYRQNQRLLRSHRVLRQRRALARKFGRVAYLSEN